jgi:hypothetical protein
MSKTGSHSSDCTRSSSPAGTADPAEVTRLASWTRKFSNLRVAERSTGETARQSPDAWHRQIAWRTCNAQPDCSIPVAVGEPNGSGTRLSSSTR